MGPRYSNIGAAQALVRRGAKSLIVASPDTISAYADGGVLKVAKAAGIPGQVFPIKLPITDANSTILKLVQAAGDGGGVILDFTPDSAPGAHAGRRRPGPRRQGEVGLVDPDRQRVHGEAVPAVRRQDRTSTRSSATSTRRLGRTRRSTRQISKKYAPSIALQAFGQMGFMDAKFATQALLSIKGAGHREVVQQGGQGAQERQDEHALQAVVRRRTLAVPHPEQHRHHGHLQERQGRDRRRSASRSRRSTRELAQTRVWEKKFNLNTGEVVSEARQ